MYLKYIELHPRILEILVTSMSKFQKKKKKIMFKIEEVVKMFHVFHRQETRK